MTVAAAVLAVLPWLWFAARDARPGMDFWAATLPAWTGAATVAAAAVGWWPVAASWTGMGLVAVVGPWRPRRAAVTQPAPSTAFRLAGVNALYLNDRPVQAADDVVALDADVCGVVELTSDLAGALAGRFVHEVACPVDGVHTGVGLYSRFPFTLLEAPELHGRAISILRARVEGLAGPFVLYVVHLRPPWRRGHLDSRQHLAAVGDLLDAMAAEQLPAVLAGDLNLPDRGQGYRRLAAARVDAMRAGWAAPTYAAWHWRPALLRIDHLALPPGWGAAAPVRSKVRGSDHLAVSAAVGPAGPR